jgi:hypothetical protein
LILIVVLPGHGKMPANPTKAAKPRRAEPKMAANIIFRRFT